MKNKKTRFLACLLCVSVLLSTGYFSGGFGAMADAIHGWMVNESELESLSNILNKKLDSPLGSVDNPMLVLEIVPSPEMAEIGYFFRGGEPIDMEKAMYDNVFSDTYYNNIKEHIGGAYTIKKEYCFYERLSEQKKLHKNATIYDDGSLEEKFKTNSSYSYTSESHNYGQWHKCATWEGTYEEKGDYVSVGENNGSFSKVSDDKYMYVGENLGDFKWVASENGKMTRSIADGDVFVITYLEHNNELVKYVYGDTIQDFKTNVITVTPSELTDLDKLLKKNSMPGLIQTADFISIHGGPTAYKNLAEAYNYMSAEKVDIKNKAPSFHDVGNDLSCEQVLTIVKRMAGSNPAALFLDKEELKASSTDQMADNCHKLLFMLFTYKPATFWNTFKDYLKYDETNPNSKLEYTAIKSDGNDAYPASMYWGVSYNTPDWNSGQKSATNPFIFLPEKEETMLDQLRYYQVGKGGSKDIFEKMFTYSGDATNLNSFFSKNEDIGKVDIQDNFDSTSITSEAFVGDYENKEKLSNMEALKYILTGPVNGGIVPHKLRILEVQPENSFIYGTKNWKVYYQNMLKGYHPTTNKAGSWLDDEKLLTVDTMPIWQFIGSTGTYDYSDTQTITSSSSDDLISKYDIILFGCLGSVDVERDNATKNRKVNDTTNYTGVIYSAVGDRVDTGNTSEEGKKQSRYQGNDLTLKKLLELEDFAAAGKMLIFDRKLNGTGYIDKDSLLWNLMTLNYTGSNNRQLNTTVRQTDMVRLMKDGYCDLKFLNASSYPRTYGYDSTTKDGLSGVINGEYYQGGSTLTYQFKIDGASTDTYSVSLHVDANGDGVYGGSLKETSLVANMNTATGSTSYAVDSKEKALKGLTITTDGGDAVNANALSANKEYQASISLPSSMRGIIPWKLEVQCNERPKLRSSAIGYTAIKASEKVKINVLQMHLRKELKDASADEKTKNFEENFSLFTTKYVDIGDGVFVDEEGYYPSHSLNMADSVFSGEDKYKNQKRTAERFQTYLSGVEDFDVNIQFLYNSDWKTMFKPSSYDTNSAEYKQKLEDFENFLGQYDMLVLGFMDIEMFTFDALYKEAVEDFIAQGKSVIFSHDMVRDSSFVETPHQKWLREVTGQYKTYYHYDDTTSTFDGKKNEAYLNGKKITLSTDEMFRDNDTQMMLWQLTTSGEYYNKDTIEYNNKKYNKDKNYGRESALFYKLKGWTWGKYGYGTSFVKLVNNGQITNYPYRIGEVIEVLQTHAQHFKLDLEHLDGGDVNVWATLTDRYSDAVIQTYGADIPASNDTDVYSAREGDVTNSFYIYTKGNVTYTGLGHNWALYSESAPQDPNRDRNCLLTNDEIKLFINTMISSYRQAEEKPRIVIANADASTKNGRSSLFYMDYDENAKAGVSGKVVTKNDKQYVKIDFYMEDPSLNPDPTKKYFMHLTSPDIAETEYLADSVIVEYGNAAFGSSDKTLKSGAIQKRYAIDHISEVGTDLSAKSIYSLYLPYEYVEAKGGQFTLKLNAYAEYQRNNKTLSTNTSTAQAVLVYLPLFDLN